MAVQAATLGLPFTENFELKSYINSSPSSARVSDSGRGVTLASARGEHKTQETIFEFPDEVFLPDLGEATINDLDIQDMDGDNQPDIIVASADELFILYADLVSGDLSYNAVQVAAGSHSALAIEDYTGNGSNDLIALKQVGQRRQAFLYKNDGRGGFASGHRIYSGSLNALATARVNDDAHFDLILVASNTALIIENNGKGKFNRRRGRIRVGDANQFIVSADFDGNNHADLLFWGSTLKVFLSNGVFGNSWPFTEKFLLDDEVSSVAIGDVDNTGDMDFVVGADGVRSTPYLNDGVGNFEAGVRIGGTRSTVILTLSEIDGDGDFDLLEGDGDDNSSIYPNVGGAYEDAGLKLDFSVADVIRTGDLNNDSYQDAVFGSDVSLMKVCLNTSVSTTAASTTLFDVGHGWIESRKVNADGVVPELIYLTATETRPANTAVTYYLSNNGGARWYQVRSGSSFKFPERGYDLRWAARLSSLSPTTSPVIQSVSLEGGLQVYIDNKAYRPGETYDAGRVGVGSSRTVTLRLWNRGEKELRVGFTLQYDNQGFSLPEVASDAGTSRPIAGGGKYETPLVFQPGEHGLRRTDLTISGSEGSTAIPAWRATLEGIGVGAKIVVGEITVQPTRVRSSSTFPVPVGNAGNRALQITDAATDPFDEFEAAAFPWQTQTISMMSSLIDYQFVFRPKRRGTATATLTLHSDAYNDMRKKVLLEGWGLAPVLRVSPAGAYSFGTVRSGGSTTRTMEVGNHGDALLEIKSLAVGNNLFSVEAADGQAAAPYRVEEMSSASFVLSFAPRTSSRGSTRTELTIISDDPFPARTTYTIMLHGKAVSPKLQFELAVCPAVKADGGLCKFGDAEVGPGKSTTLTITNVGHGEVLVISSVVVTGGDFSVHGPSSATIAVRGSSTWQVRFSPSGYGPTPNGIMLTINNNDPENENGKPKVALEGRGIGADLAVSIDGVALEDGDGYSFEDQSVGDSTSVLVVVSNTDAEADEIALRVSGIALSSTSSFAWPSSTTFTLEPKTSTTLHVSFRPSRRGMHETMLTITSNHLGGKPYQVRLAGTGTAPALVLAGFAGCAYATMTRTCDFGGVLAGGTSSVKIIVGNVGEEALRVTPTVSGGVYRLDGPADRLLDSGSTGTWTLHFSPPVAATSYAGALVFESNDPASSSRTVRLDGHGVGPKMVIEYSDCNRISTGTFWFGGGYHSCYMHEALVGTTETVRVTIHNKGNRDLKIGSISLSETYGGYYRLDGPASAVITASKSAQWSVNCSALRRLDFPLNTNLNISSNYRGTVARQSLPCTVVWSVLGVSVDGRSYSPDGTHGFGEVETGTSRTVPVVITNTGQSRALVVRSLETSGTGFSIVGGGAGAWIAANTSRTWWLRFSPEDTTTHTGTLTVHSDDRGRSEWRMNLEGKGVAAGLFVSRPPERVFEVSVGGTDRQKVTIENTGTAPLIIESIVVTPGDFAPAVSAPDDNEDVRQWLNERRRMAYTVTGGTRKLELDPGASTTFIVAFSPHVPSDKDNAALTIRSNLPAETVPLRGTGLGPLLLASIGADENRRYVLSKATTHNVGTLVAGGDVAVSTKVTVHLENLGNQDLWVFPALTTGSEAFRLSTDVYSEYLIPQNKLKNITVEFHPIEPGTHTRTLTLTTSGSAVATHTIRFHGSRRLPLLEVGFGNGCRPTTQAQTCNLGLVNVTTAQTATLFVTNNSATTLNVTPSLADAGGVYSLADPATQSVTAGSIATWIVRLKPRVVATTYPATLTFTGDRPDAAARVNLTGVGAGPIPEVTYSGCTVTSSYCDLPDVPYGMTTTVRVTVANTGNADLIVRALDVPSRYDHYSPYTIEGSFPTTITSRSSHTWKVHLRPVEQQHRIPFAHIKDLQVISNYHGATPTKTLRALVIWPQIEVQVNGDTYLSSGASASLRTDVLRGPYDFGTVWAGTTAATLTIRNTGDLDLVLTSIQVSGTGFSLDDTSTTTIAAAATITRKLHFSPISTVAMISEGVLTITGNDSGPGRARYTLALQGEVPDMLPDFGNATIATQTYLAHRRITTLTLPTATSGNGTLRYALTPSLPDGLERRFRSDTNTYEITGTPMAVSTMTTYTWTATDGDGDVAVLTFPITVFDYDRDEDGLIEIGSLMQLNAIRWDLDGDGRPSTNVAGYTAAFPGATLGMGCRQSSTTTGVCRGYELVADLDFDTGTTGIRTDDLYYNGGKGWEPIAPCSSTDSYSCSSSDPRYAATFDGNGHNISNVYIRRRNHDYTGLFARLADSSNVTRVKLLNVDVEGRVHVGGMAGRNRGSISASCVTGAVKGRVHWSYPSNVGGLVGWNSGEITASCATGTVSEGRTVGGLAGRNTGKITASYATGVVDGKSSVGGLVGENTGEITASYATGAVRGSYVGGLVGRGYARSKITASYATGAVNGNSWLGGLTGENDGEIVASYATGAVNGSRNIGGLVGENNGEIAASYATGAVNGESYTGGLVGTTISSNGYEAVTINSYWDTRTSSRTESAGGTGKKTFELRSPTAYTGIYAAWNVDVDGVVGADNPWDFGTRAQYPILQYGHSTTSLALQRAVQPAISADSRLSALSVRNATPGTGAALPLSPPFDAGTVSYFATAGSGTGWVTIAATAASTRATVVVATSYQGLLASGGSAIGTVTVTAQDGSATAYTIVVGRAGTDVSPSFDTAMIAQQIYVAGASVDKTLPQARGGNGALHYALTGPGSAATLALPLGLSLDAGTRTLSGVPATAFTMATYIWTATDSDGDATTLAFTIAVTGSKDYDSDNNGLIEIRSLSQLHAIRWDLNGDGTPDGAADSLSYAPAFPGAMAGMGCPTTGAVPGCKGYELMTALNFNTGYWFRTDDLYYNGGAGWEPVGGISGSYAAIFDGNGNGISNLYIKRRNRDYIGLFGYLADSSSITRVKLLSVNVEGNYNVGGVAGRNKGSISASCAEGVVYGAHYVGGFVGRNSGTISASCAKGTVTSTGHGIGGFVGINRPGGKIYANYATGAVNGRFGTGGLIGTNSGEIVASYATGAVDGESGKGGLVGRNYGEIVASYATGAVSGWSWWGSDPGGLVGGTFDSGTVTNSYWNTITSGRTSSRGGIGKSTSELQSPTTYTGIYAAWNVDLDGVAGSDNPWDFGTSTQYPALRYGGHDVSSQRPPTETATRE